VFPLRVIRIASAVAALLLFAVRLRMVATAAGPTLPRRLCTTLEGLGTTFVKLGQALSLHRDLLPDECADALQDLQDRASPFPGEQAMREVEAVLRRPLAELSTAV
jgi:ubiquinone biosynthesis protein